MHTIVSGSTGLHPVCYYSLSRTCVKTILSLVVSLIYQKHAWHLFNSFMMNVVNFLRIFDPILNSFRMLHTREPFCFTVIPFLASCIGGSPSSFACVQDVKDLMSGSLFYYPVSLGKV